MTAHTLPTQETHDELFKQAMGATLDQSEAYTGGAKHYFGKVELELSQVALIRGVGRVPYDASDPTQRGMRPSLEISISLHCKDRNGNPYTLNRTMLAFDRRQPDWVAVTLPSLQALGVVEPSSLKPFAHCELVQTGAYTDRQGNEKRLTAFRFVALFSSEQEMNAARDQFFSERGHANGAMAQPAPQAHTNGNGHTPKPVATVAQPAPQARTNGATGNSGRAAVLNVVATLWKTALHTDDPPATLESLMQGIPVVKAAGITIDDPEVQAWIARDHIPF